MYGWIKSLMQKSWSYDQPGERRTEATWRPCSNLCGTWLSKHLFFFKGWTKANFQFFLEVDWKLFWMILMFSTDGKHWILSCVTTRNVAWQFRWCWHGFRLRSKSADWSLARLRIEPPISSCSRCNGVLAQWNLALQRNMPCDTLCVAMILLWHGPFHQIYQN